MTPRWRAFARLIAVAVVAIGLGIIAPAPPTVASCVGSELAILGRASASPSPTSAGDSALTLRRGEEVVVAGQWFRDGCADTGSTGGCAPSIRYEVERPMADVELVLRHANRDLHTNRDMVLATADADGKPPFLIQWTVRIPTDAPIGASTLEAANAKLAVDVTR